MTETQEIDPKMSVSQIMRSLHNHDTVGSEISVDEILEIFGVRGFPLLLVLLGLLNIVVVFLPGFSLLVGIPMIVISAQMVMGMARPILPPFILGLTFARDRVAPPLEKGAMFVEFLETYIQPRFSFLVRSELDRVNALVCLFLSCLVAVPLPLLNIPPSIGLILVALGLLGRDGLFIVLGYFFAASCIMMYLMFGALVALVVEMALFFGGHS